MMRATTTEAGFGLIELLVTLAVLTLVISIGVPSFQGITTKNQAVARIDELNTAVRLARQVAIEHNFQSRICAKSTNTLDGTTCGSSSQWSNGFLVQVFSSDSSWQTIQNKSYAIDGTSIVVAKMSTSTLLASIGFEPTGNLDSNSGPNTAITISRSGCTATTTVNIAGRVVSAPLSGC